MPVRAIFRYDTIRHDTIRYETRRDETIGYALLSVIIMILIGLLGPWYCSSPLGCLQVVSQQGLQCNLVQIMHVINSIRAYVMPVSRCESSQPNCHTCASFSFCPRNDDTLLLIILKRSSSSVHYGYTCNMAQFKTNIFGLARNSKGL